jgi:hypothetical protein
LLDDLDSQSEAMVLEVGYAAQDMKVRNFGSWERVRGLKGWMEEQQKIDDMMI